MEPSQPEGYLAQPASGKGRGVLVLHPWWGLNDTIKGVCDRLAGEGYTAFAPDLYHGEIADTIEGAEALAHALDEERAWADIAAAAEFLSEQSALPEDGLAAMGFSLGAYFALELSNKDPQRFRTVVVFYGTGPQDFSRSQAIYLGHFAEHDQFEPAAEVDALEGLLKEAGRQAAIYRYPGTGHWFFEPDRTDAYDDTAARLAWQRTLAFLKTNL